MGEDGMVGACMEPGESGDEWVWGPPIFWAIRILEEIRQNTDRLKRNGWIYFMGMFMSK
jgi:hypothetical protein